MSMMQLASTSMASELLQSVGVELAIFVVTLVLAVTFRASPFGKHAASKSPKSPKLNSPRAENRGDAGAGRSSISGTTRQPKHCPTLGQALAPCDVLSPRPWSLFESMVNCASRRQAADAISMFEEIKATGDNAAFQDALKHGKHSPIDVFNWLVQCAGRIGRTELIEVLLEDMASAGIERPLAFYESTMKILASKKCYKEALSVCSLLEADGLEPSPITLSCLVSFAVELGDSDRAISFFNRLAACSMPSIRAYMTILRVYSRRQNWPSSVALVRDMQNRQARMDSLVLNIVLSTGVAAGQLEATKALLQEFSPTGIADVISYNTVMKGFAQQKHGGQAIKLLDEMSQVGVKPNAITFNTAMDAVVRSSQGIDAWQVLARMVEAGLSPDKFTCTTLMKGLQNGASSEQLAVILDLLRNVTQQCDPTLCATLFRSVIEATVQVNDPALTARAVSQMRDQRVLLPPQEYQRLVQVLLRESDAKDRSAVCHQPQIETMRCKSNVPWRMTSDRSVRAC